MLLPIAIVVLLPHLALAETDAERKARIEKELSVIEQQILHQEVLVENKQQERQSLERDVNILDAQISKAQLGIQARALAIEQLSDQIGEKEVVIEVLDERVGKQRQSLGELIRKTEEVDSFSLVELLLSNQNFSEFFTDFENFRSINQSLKESMTVLADIKYDTQVQKQSLEHKQATEAELKGVQETEKQRIERQEAEKERILRATKGEEAAYQQLLNESRKSAAQLRAQLFALLGGGGAIPFPDAVVLAQNASAVTGVPAALILAILEQESEYGSNLGSCTMGDVSSGKDIMHPDRDKPVFLAIAAELGFNPSTQRVSCPIRRADGTRLGWGGAMGPSQFIPSTWAVYGGFVSSGSGWVYSAGQDAIRSLLGKTTPSNPFNNQDAFLATALLLRDNGSRDTYSSDRTAALRYYAGWGGASNPENQFYGDNVMTRKARLVSEIAILQGG